MNNNKTSYIKKIAILSSIVVLIIIAISIIIKILTANYHKVIINNIQSCSPNILTSAQDNFSTQFYSYITKQDNVNQVKTLNTYHASIRESSCKTDEFKDSDGTSYKTTAIIDLTDRQYSYKVAYYWAKKTNTPKNVKFAPLSVYCLSEENSIYPDFNCELLPIIQEEPDPIISILPYFGEYYSLEPFISTTSTSGYGIIVIYDPPEDIYLSGKVSQFQQETDAAINEYLNSHDINIANYAIVKKFAVVGVD